MAEQAKRWAWKREAYNVGEHYYHARGMKLHVFRDRDGWRWFLYRGDDLLDSYMRGIRPKASKTLRDALEDGKEAAEKHAAEGCPKKATTGGA